MYWDWANPSDPEAMLYQVGLLGMDPRHSVTTVKEAMIHSDPAVIGRGRTFQYYFDHSLSSFADERPGWHRGNKISIDISEGI